MNKTMATINGLMEGISVIETDNTNEYNITKDILYNSEEPIDFTSMYYDEGFTVSEYRVEDFGEPITLLSTITMKEALLKNSIDTL